MHRFRRNPLSDELFHLQSELAQIELLLQESLPPGQCAALKNRHLELCRVLDSINPLAA